MRRSCLDCVRKHLASAGIFIKETKLGYPDYDIWVIGELEHAADESLRENKDLAQLIREHRLQWMVNKEHYIPIEELNKYIKACQLADASKLEHPELPEELYIGLTTSDGSLVTSGDTRPQ